MLIHPRPPSTLHQQFKALTVTATQGCNHLPPFPPLTFIVTSPVPPTPLPPLLPFTLRLLLLHPIVSALLPPQGNISSEAAQCQKVCLHCQDLEVYTTIHNLSQLSTTQTTTRELSSTTIKPVRDISRRRTLSTTSGINQLKPKLSEPVSQVPQPIPAWLWEALPTPSLASCPKNLLSWGKACA